jgi:hypothetical protein
MSAKYVSCECRNIINLNVPDIPIGHKMEPLNKSKKINDKN